MQLLPFAAMKRAPSLNPIEHREIREENESVPGRRNQTWRERLISLRLTDWILNSLVPACKSALLTVAHPPAGL